MNSMDLSYIINHLGEERENYFNAVSPPVIQTSNFCFNSVAKLRESIPHEMEVPFYTRGANPTVSILRKKLAALEGTQDCLVFGSGVAAISAAVVNSVSAGDHVILVNNPYGWTDHLLNVLLKKFDVSCTMVDGRAVANFERNVQHNTRLIVLESPTSMMFDLQDVEAVCQFAKSKNIRTIIDSSYASPLNMQPYKMGVDIVVHTASKYFGGHSDVVGGVLCSNNTIIKSIFQNEFMTFGGIMSPHDAFLVIRSLRTLPLRMERIARSAKQVIEFLAKHEKVEKVLAPLHSSHPQFQLAQKQFSNPGGIFSVLLKLDGNLIEKFVDSLDRFLLACSWGGHESLVFPAIAMLGIDDHPELKVPPNLVRFYIGLEDPEVLIEDIGQAFNKV